MFYPQFKKSPGGTLFCRRRFLGIDPSEILQRPPITGVSTLAKKMPFLEN
jgi:hypothetical protein